MTPKEIATEMNVTRHTVLLWIASGKLQANNVGRGAKKPRYDVRREDLEAFKAQSAS